MLSAQRPDLFKTHFDEIAIADFGPFQLAVPTTTTSLESSPQSQRLVPPKRNYSGEGWVICRDRIVGTLSNLEIGEAPTASGIFQPIQRFSPAIPVAFEVHSRQPLPVAISQLAQFACPWQDAKSQYFTIFRHVSPRFTRVYAVLNWPYFPVINQVRRFLAEESQFIATNRKNLQQVPFYRERFGL